MPAHCKPSGSVSEDQTVQFQNPPHSRQTLPQESWRKLRQGIENRMRKSTVVIRCKIFCKKNRCNSCCHNNRQNNLLYIICTQSLFMICKCFRSIFQKRIPEQLDAIVGKLNTSLSSVMHRHFTVSSSFSSDHKYCFPIGFTDRANLIINCISD